MKKHLLYIIPLLLVIAAGAFLLWTVKSPVTTNGGSFNLRDGETADDVQLKIQEQLSPRQTFGLRLLAWAVHFDRHVHSGHYEIVPNSSSFDIIRQLKNGIQTPIRLTIPSVRTKEDLSGQIARRLMMDSTSLVRLMGDSSLCSRYGMDTATVICLFIPNTYEVYWNISPQRLLDRMKREYDAFWTPQRKTQAKAHGLTPVEAMTLASIIDEETAYVPEKNNIAGMYLNRLHRNMLLQADPTVKYALRQFQLRRIYNDMLTTDSPYNTYRYPGLPPGPIRIPTVSAIDAVLNAAEHDYLYMCAKDDFSGSHQFAHTLSEHMANARRYIRALNQRGIR
ncbi:MAG: endolytic transglycosylase MltG [Bacteroidaceae bacterium]|nr:endolytic transglycosylase MltG [Bacteroidaceae bacterium]